MCVTLFLESCFFFCLRFNGNICMYYIKEKKNFLCQISISLFSTLFFQHFKYNTHVYLFNVLKCIIQWAVQKWLVFNKCIIDIFKFNLYWMTCAMGISMEPNTKWKCINILKVCLLKHGKKVMKMEKIESFFFCFTWIEKFGQEFILFFFFISLKVWF